MKKLFSVLLALSMIFLISACNNNKETESELISSEPSPADVYQGSWSCMSTNTSMFYVMDYLEIEGYTATYNRKVVFGSQVNNQLYNTYRLEFDGENAALICTGGSANIADRWDMSLMEDGNLKLVSDEETYIFEKDKN